MGRRESRPVQTGVRGDQIGWLSIMSEKTLSGRAFAVIGATGGIGSALSRALAARGASLLIGSRSEEALARLSSELGCRHKVVDASSFPAVEEFLGSASSLGDPLCGVANCAGSVLLRPAHLTSEEDLEAVMAANLKSAFSTVRAAVRFLKDGAGSAVEGCGSIVLVSSAAATVGMPHHEAISAAKGAVEGLVRSAAATYASWGVRVNAVAPGMVHTPATERIVSRPASLAASVAYHAMDRIGRPEEVAELMTWLLSPHSAWVTGQVWGIDGGLAGTKVVKTRA